MPEQSILEKNQQGRAKRRRNTLIVWAVLGTIAVAGSIGGGVILFSSYSARINEIESLMSEHKNNCDQLRMAYENILKAHEKSADEMLSELRRSAKVSEWRSRTQGTRGQLQRYSDAERDRVAPNIKDEVTRSELSLNRTAARINLLKLGSGSSFDPTALP